MTGTDLDAHLHAIGEPPAGTQAEADPLAPHVWLARGLLREQVAFWAETCNRKTDDPDNLALVRQKLLDGLLAHLAAVVVVDRIQGGEHGEDPVHLGSQVQDLVDLAYAAADRIISKEPEPASLTILTCARCARRIPSTLFATAPGRRGRQSWCRRCTRDYTRESQRAKRKGKQAPKDGA